MEDTDLVMFILAEDQICRINAGRVYGRHGELPSFNFI